MEEDEDVIPLMFEKIAGNISPADEVYLDNLIKENPSIKKKWLEIKAFSESPRSQYFLNNANENEGWEQVSSEIKSRKSLNSRYYFKYVIALAACLLILVSFSYYFFSTGVAPKVQVGKLKSIPEGITLTLNNGTSIGLNSGEHKDFRVNDTVLNITGPQAELSTSWNTLTVPQKLDYKIILSDGSEVYLNSSSSLKFPSKFSADKREVILEGEGFFKVSKSKSQPFIVHCRETQTVVLGTEFNINSYSTEVSTALVTGSVLAKSNGKELLLKPGFQTKYVDGKGFETNPFDEDLITSWMQGSYHFENTKLEAISKIIPRWFGVTVVFEKEDARSQRLTGEINKHKPLTVFLENLRSTADIKYSLKNNVLSFK